MQHRKELPRHLPIGKRTPLSSRNWSGAIVPALSGRRFSRIAASWEVPRLPRRPQADAEDAMISIWIGLGGWQAWSKSMPHMGTEHGWDDDGKLVHRFWCQWWLGKDSEDGWLSWIVQGVNIEPGDEILCHLAVVGENTVEFYFLNRRTGQLAGVQAVAPRPPTGSSSQWIVERPMRVEPAIRGKHSARSGAKSSILSQRLQPVGLHPLPPIKEVILRDCVTRLGTSADFRLRTLQDATPVSLIDWQRGGVAGVAPHYRMPAAETDTDCDVRWKIERRLRKAIRP